MKLNCIIYSISAYGPKDKDGIGMNSCIGYIPIDSLENITPKTISERYKGLSSYAVEKIYKIYDKHNLSLFQKLNDKQLFVPVCIEFEGDTKSSKITKISTI